jgi:hypothetical protein
MKTTNTVVKVAVEPLLHSGMKLSKTQLRSTRQKAWETVYGHGEAEWPQLEATAAAVQACGHFVRVFRWTPQQMMLELESQAHRAWRDAFNKRDRKKPFNKWKQVLVSVKQRCVAGPSCSDLCTCVFAWLCVLHCRNVCICVFVCPVLCLSAS